MRPCRARRDLTIQLDNQKVLPMKNASRFSMTVLALAISAASHTFAAESADSIAAALSGGDAELGLRYRFEQVDQDGIADKGYASTLKTRITYKSLAFNDFQANLEFDNNTDVIESNYGGNRPAIADAEYTEVNQAFVDYAGLADTIVRYGRQRINLDNERHVGGVAWRQNEQTYDAAAVVNKSLANTTITVANIMNVNTITNTNLNGEDHQILHVNNNALEALNVSGYALMLDKISDTYGLRATGKLGDKELAFNYAAEYATQETDDAAKNDSDYMLLEVGAELAQISATLGLETLGSDNGNAAFQTPLATKHKFNGWADKFLVTPANGLEDMYLSLGTKALGPALTLAYHQFDSDENSVDYGDEINFSVGHKFTDNYSGLIKFADYSQGDVGTPADTQKIWLQLEAKF